MDTLVPSGPAAAGSIRQRAYRLRTAPARLRLRIARTSHALSALDAPSACAASSLRDYCHEVLGVPARTFRGYADVGALVHAVPGLGPMFLNGECQWTALQDIAASGLDPTPWLQQLPDLTSRQLRDRLAAAKARMTAFRQAPPDAEPSIEGADPSFAPLSLRLPRSVVLFAQATDELAKAVLGAECAEDDRWQAVIAEASTEIEPTVSARSACRRFKLDPEKLAVTEETLPSRAQTLESEDDASPHEEDLGVSPEAWPQPGASQHACASGLPGLEHGDDVPTRLNPPLLQIRARNAVVRLQNILSRLLKREREVDRHCENELLELYREGAHRKLGFSRFEDFAREMLDLAPRTTWQLLDRARERLRNDPLARAYDRGQISAMQLHVLKELRKLHVPDSALQPWIDAARTTTVRGLRDFLTWARGQVVTDYRAWSLANFPPPTWDQLRTSARSLETLAKNPEPPDIVQLAAEPTRQFRIVLHKETIVHLVQLMASMQQEVEKQHGARVPDWLAFLHVCTLARRAWARTDPERLPKRHRIHDRDGYRCGAPGCSSRKGMEGHHIDYLSRGGDDHPHNLITLCGFHHREGEHGGRLRVRGRAVHGRFSLRFEMGRTDDGRPLAVFQGEQRVGREGGQPAWSC